ncbi:MAG: hypothetical protein AAGU27_14545 [Dehalobacterium sp.]
MGTISEEVLKAVQETAKDGKLTCTDAHMLGEKLGISLLVIGEAADQLGIKIKNCQLGCF